MGNDRYSGSFEYSNGIYTGLLGLGISSVNGINNNGQIVGTVTPSPVMFNGANYAATATGFLYSNGNFSIFTAPQIVGGPEENSIATGINDSGQVVGTIPWGVRLGMGPADGFVYDNGNLTVLSNQGGFYGINNSGQIIGNAGWQGSVGAFVYNNGTYSSLPNFEGNYIHASGINNNGLIVGHFYQATGSPL